MPYRNPDALTRCEKQVIRCIAVDSLTVGEAADKLCVVYQCVANHLQTIYDKLGIKRNLHALTKWYYTADGARKIGAMVLAMLFSAEVLNANGHIECRMLRTPRRGGRNEIEILIEI